MLPSRMCCGSRRSPGGRSSTRFLAAAANVPEDELNRALRAAVDDFLLTHDSTTARYAFRHALLREAIYSDLLPGERRSLHRTLAQTLSERPDLAGGAALAEAELAYHWYAAGELPTALRASLAAGFAAEELRALGEAWLHYARALEIWDRLESVPDELPLGRCDLLRRAADAAVLTGDVRSGLRIARELLAEVDEQHEPVDAALAHERLGRYLWMDGCGDASLPEYARAVELMPTEPQSEPLAYVLAAEGQALMLCHRFSDSLRALRAGARDRSGRGSRGRRGAHPQHDVRQSDRDRRPGRSRAQLPGTRSRSPGVCVSARRSIAASSTAATRCTSRGGLKSRSRSPRRGSRALASSA